MDTIGLKNFAQESRRYLMDVVKKKIDYYLTTDNADIRAKQSLIDDLKKEITNTSKDQVIEKIAYTWFNRFCALRYMDVKQYSLVGVLTPASAEHTQPEILMEAKSGHIKEELGRKENRDQVIALLSGKASSSDPQSDAYKLLLLMACNYYHSIMPFLFEKVDDYTELLMPDDLLSESSIVSKTREALSIDNCENVEVIGWLYQFYISEKKDEVFAGLKSNKKITPENIPAATQLFTPNWIVRYLVENSLGRLWMLNRPQSTLISKMEYYIKPESAETDFLKINSPEEIKICDPACGSGHMLVYAFDLLYLMYEEVGVDPNEIPSLILKNNLFGVEIDKRAGELAAFALTMKAREKQRRYFRSPVQPNICVLENIHFEKNEIKEYIDHIGRDLFTVQFQNTLYQFEEAKNFGSLIKPELTDVDNIRSLLDQKNVSGDLLLSHTHSKVLRVLSQVVFLSPKYHVVIANPPYMGASNANPSLKNFLSSKFKDGKSDLMTAFVIRAQALTIEKGLVAAVTLDSWMFLSSYQSFRNKLFAAGSVSTLVHVGWNCFPDGHTYNRGVAFVFDYAIHSLVGKFINLSNVNATVDKHNLFLDRLRQKQIYRVENEVFGKLPGQPLAYWMSEAFRRAFDKLPPLGKFAEFRIGMATGKNELYVRLWHEVSVNRVGFRCPSRELALASHMKWFPYAKGGAFRRWAGNREHLVNWEKDGSLLQNTKHPSGERVWAHNFNLSSIFKPAVCWTQVTDAGSSFRYYPEGFLFDAAAGMGQPISSGKTELMLGLLNSAISEEVQSFLNPTRNILPGTLSSIPTAEVNVISIVSRLVEIAENDWNSFETSWDFKGSPLLETAYRKLSLKTAYEKLRTSWQVATEEMKKLEEENNRVFIEAYELQNELKAEVSLDEITLACNPHYRYGGDKIDAELDALLLADTMREFISYSVGCMFGRYSLDKEGLILVNQGETINDYLKQVSKPTFAPDGDNVIPLLDGDWFSDEISERFKKFLKGTFGENNFEENLKFLEEAIGKDIRKYFAKDFYNDHVKVYKKRPIYWMFSSPNGTFNALIYMHRYTPDTVSIVLNSYLREFRTKLSSKRENLERLSSDASASAREKASAVKEIEQLKKMIVELNEYEKDILYPLATQRLEINLDDGVKANYPKFGKALKTIKGLDKDED